MYSFQVHKKGDVSDVKKAKGVSKPTVSKVLQHQDYVDCLFKQHYDRHSMEGTGSEKHHLILKRINKISLSSNDDKRYWLNADGIDSYAYGHYIINSS